MMLAQTIFASLLQVVDLALQLLLRKIGEFDRILLALNQGLEHGPARDA